MQNNNSPRFKIERNEKPIHVSNEALSKDSPFYKAAYTFPICFASAVKCSSPDCKQETLGGFPCEGGHIVPLCYEHKPHKRIACDLEQEIAVR